MTFDLGDHPDEKAIALRSLFLALRLLSAYRRRRQLRHASANNPKANKPKLRASSIGAATVDPLVEVVTVTVAAALEAAKFPLPP